MPIRMTGSIQSVVVQGTVYVGGGFTGTGHGNIVQAYDRDSQKWTLLPPYGARDFAMTKIDGQLVLVGGWMDSIPKPGVWKTDINEWVHPYPEMPTARAFCTAFVYGKWLVVAGGIESYSFGSYEALSTVEIMNTDSKQWYTAPPTPKAWDSMKTVLVGDVCYFLGSNMHSLYLPSLISHINSEKFLDEDKQIWKDMPGPSLTSSSPLSMNGSLFAVSMSSICIYQTDTNEWVKVGDLPTQQRRCTSIMSAEREIFVAGGNEVNIAQIK